jgi:hypothetical protein
VSLIRPIKQQDDGCDRREPDNEPHYYVVIAGFCRLTNTVYSHHNLPPLKAAIPRERLCPHNKSHTKFVPAAFHPRKKTTAQSKIGGYKENFAHVRAIAPLRHCAIAPFRGGLELTPPQLLVRKFLVTLVHRLIFRKYALIKRVVTGGRSGSASTVSSTTYQFAEAARNCISKISSMLSAATLSSCTSASNWFFNKFDSFSTPMCHMTEFLRGAGRLSGQSIKGQHGQK